VPPEERPWPRRSLRPGVSPPAKILAVQLLSGPDPVPDAAATRDPILDERARTEIRSRLRQLEEVLTRAEAAGNVNAAERAASERDALLRELRVATGLGGRRRSLDDPGERARKAVTGRIRDSIEKIRLSLPDLARHLDESITTGSSCSYVPPAPTRWRT
jgi:hypothetical protein